MTNQHHLNHKWLAILILGDGLVILAVTIAGFANHGTLLSAGSRIFTTIIPLALAWTAVAPLMGAYRYETVSDARMLWKPFWAMVVAGPFAAFLRSVLLGGTPILPLFVVILGGFGAIGILVWRLAFVLIHQRSTKHDR